MPTSRRMRACSPSTPSCAQQEPELERAEAAAQRDAPVAQVAHEAVLRGAQVARVGAHHAHQVLGVAHVVGGEVEAGAHPLVRVEDDGVGALDALPHPAVLGADHRRAGERRVDVQPQAVARAEGGDAGHRVERRGRGRADRGDHGAGPAAGRQVLVDRALQQVQPERVLVVGLDEAQVLGAEAGEERRLGHRAVRLVARVDDERRVLGLQAAAVLARSPRCARGRRAARMNVEVLAVSSITPVNVSGRPTICAQPLHDDVLDLGRGRAGLPAHALRAEPGRDEVGEHRREVAVAGEVVQEAGVVPVRDARHDDAVEVGDDAAEVSALQRRLGGQLRRHLARLRRGS